MEQHDYATNKNYFFQPMPYFSRKMEQVKANDPPDCLIPLIWQTGKCAVFITADTKNMLAVKIIVLSTTGANFAVRKTRDWRKSASAVTNFLITV